MNSNKYTKAFALVTSLFFMWGFITVLVDSLIPRLKEVFELSYSQAFFVQFAFFIAYGLLSIPAGAILSRIGYKKGMMLGLAVMGVGCLLFYPAASLRVFPIFLLAYFTLAGGMSILQVAANPYVSVLGPERTASSRLNLSQAFNSLGTAIAPAVGAILILSDDIKSSDEIAMLTESAQSTYYNAEASAVQMPFIYLAVALLGLAAIVSLVKLPQLLNKLAKGGYGQAFKNRNLKLGAIGIFLYVGAEVAIGSCLVNYFLDMNLAQAIKDSGLMAGIASWVHGDLTTVDSKGIVGAFVMFYWSGAMIGRFVGALLTKFFKPNNVLVVFAGLAITFIVLSMCSTGFLSMWAILLVGLFNSIMFPTIFTIAIDGMGNLKPQGSGILCTAIAGGAVIPPLFGFLADVSSFKLAFTLILLCYGYILFYGRTSSTHTVHA